MKTVRITLCLLLCIACLLVGCEQPSEGQPSADTESVLSATPSQETSSEDVSSDLPSAPEEQDVLTLLGQPVLPAPSALPAYCEPTGVDYLYTCLPSLPQNRETMQYGGEYVLLSGWDGDCVLYSLQTGKQVASYPSSTERRETRLQSDGSVLAVNYYWTDGTVQVLRYTPDDPTRGELVLQPKEKENYALSADGTRLLANDDKGTLYLFDLTGKTKTVAVDDMELSYGSMLGFGEGFLVQRVNGDILYLDGEGELTPVSLPAFPIRTYGGLCHCSRESGILLSDGKEDGISCFLPTDGWAEGLEQVRFGYLLTQCGEDVRFCDLREKTELRITLPGDGILFVQACFCDNGQVLLYAVTDHGGTLYLYDLPASAGSGSATEAKGLLFGTEEQIAKENRSVADRISEKTGVEVLYGSQGNDFVLWDYVGAPELDPYRLHDRLQTVEEVLSRYPDGMLREMYEKTNRGMKFYLCGRVYGVAGNGGLTEAGAVTTEIDGYIVIAFNCNDGLETNLAHELSHACDRRIGYIASHGGEDWDTVWKDANGVEPAYVYTYDSYWNNTRYTAENETDPNRVWFLDSYSRTFPTEDRARIMERLFDRTGEGIDLTEYPHLLEKAELYCRILRECFPSCASKPPFWEQALQNA